MTIRGMGWVSESLKPKQMGELFAYMQQFCLSCQSWMPRYYGSLMADGSRSTFDRCGACRGVEQAS